MIELCGCDPETGSVHTYGARFDAWGGFHILLPDAYVEIPTNYDERHARYASGERDVFHIVVDGQGELLHQKKLFDGVQQDPRTLPSAGPPIGRDDYYKPAFWSDGGAIAWTRDKGIDLTHIVLDPSSAGPAEEDPSPA